MAKSAVGSIEFRKLISEATIANLKLAVLVMTVTLRTGGRDGV